jgi:biopolymer transport protein TolR
MAFGRLERTAGANPMSEINMTPLIDVMLVLLVIFMISAPLMVSKIKVNLPKANSASSQDAPAFIRIVVDKNGQVFLDDQAHDLAAMATRLRSVAQRNPQTEVQLRADKVVPYGRMVEIMGLAHKAGLTRIGFVAEVPPAP